MTPPRICSEETGGAAWRVRVVSGRATTMWWMGGGGLPTVARKQELQAAFLVRRFRLESPKNAAVTLLCRP